jgi:hypothetical protein
MNINLNSFNFGFIQFYSWNRKDTGEFSGSGCWFRVFGKGLHFSNGHLTFSERYGYNKFMKLPFGWRVSVIKD